MKIIAKDRGLGKTHHLVNTSRKTGYPIITHCQASKKYIHEQFGHDLLVYTLSEFMVGGGVKRHHSKILIDDFNHVLECYLGVGIHEVTFSGDISIEQIENIPVVIKQDISMKR